MFSPVHYNERTQRRLVFHRIIAVYACVHSSVLIPNRVGGMGKIWGLKSPSEADYPRAPAPLVSGGNEATLSRLKSYCVSSKFT